MTNTETAPALTTTNVRALRAEASQAGDGVMVHACGLCFGAEDEIEDGADFEDRYGGGGYSADERRQIIGMSVAKARGIVREALAYAEAQNDDA